MKWDLFMGKVIWDNSVKTYFIADYFRQLVTDVIYRTSRGNCSTVAARKKHYGSARL